MSTRATRRSSPRSTQASLASERDVPGLAREGDAAHDLVRARVDQPERLRRDLEPRLRRRLTAAAQDEDAHHGDRREPRPPRPPAPRGRGGGAGARRGGASPRSAAAAAVARAPQLANRSSGAFAMAVATTASNAAGTLRPDLAGERRRLVHVGVDGRELAVAGERRLAGEALEEHAAQRVDVRPGVDRPALDLLGGDVGDVPTRFRSPVRLVTEEMCLARPKSHR